jgi:hypothetical protein
MASRSTRFACSLHRAGDQIVSAPQRECAKRHRTTVLRRGATVPGCSVTIEENRQGDRSRSEELGWSRRAFLPVAQPAVSDCGTGDAAQSALESACHVEARIIFDVTAYPTAARRSHRGLTARSKSLLDASVTALHTSVRTLRCGHGGGCCSPVESGRGCDWQ